VLPAWSGGEASRKQRYGTKRILKVYQVKSIQKTEKKIGSNELPVWIEV